LFDILQVYIYNFRLCEQRTANSEQKTNSTFYIKPNEVLTPKNKVSKLEVIQDNGYGSYSVAKLVYNSVICYAIRWNGSSPFDKHNAKGFPQSRGLPTWFILPNDIVSKLNLGGGK
jgi:hypothetical protein